ncbi:MAG TPA: hypothetical protein PLV22_00775 [Candidatus Cloacimonadota bacterium]|nr:hypothetical protein [Candidatus Cloacimonadota bacterium]
MQTIKMEETRIEIKFSTINTAIGTSAPIAISFILLTIKVSGLFNMAMTTKIDNNATMNLKNIFLNLMNRQIQGLLRGSSNCKKFHIPVM